MYTKLTSRVNKCRNRTVYYLSVKCLLGQPTAKTLWNGSFGLPDPESDRPGRMRSRKSNKEKNAQKNDRRKQDGGGTFPHVTRRPDARTRACKQQLTRSRRVRMPDAVKLVGTVERVCVLARHWLQQERYAHARLIARNLLLFFSTHFEERPARVSNAETTRPCTKINKRETRSTTNRTTEMCFRSFRCSLLALNRPPNTKHDVPLRVRLSGF